MAETQRSVTVKVRAILEGNADPFGQLADSAKKAQSDVDRLTRATQAVHTGRSPTPPPVPTPAPQPASAPVPRAAPIPSAPPLLPAAVSRPAEAQPSLQPQRVRVEADTSPLQTQTAEAIRRIQGLPATVKLQADPAALLGQSAEATRRAGASPATVKVTADTAAAQSHTEALVRAVGSLPATVKVGADVTAAQGAVEGLARSAGSSRPTIQVQADVAAAQARIAGLTASASQPARLRLDADPGAAVARIGGVRQQAERPLRIRLDADPTPLQGKLAAIPRDQALRQTPAVRILGDTSPLLAIVQAAVVRINRMTATVQVHAGTTPVQTPVPGPQPLRPPVPGMPAVVAPVSVAQPGSQGMRQQQPRTQAVSVPVVPPAARQQVEQLGQSGEKAAAAFLRAGQGVTDLTRGLLMLSAGNREMEDLLRTLMLVQGITDTFKGLTGIVGGLRDAAAARGAAGAGAGFAPQLLGGAAAGGAGAAMGGGSAIGGGGAAAGGIGALPATLIATIVAAVGLHVATRDEKRTNDLARWTAGIPGLNSSWVFNNRDLPGQQEQIQRMKQDRDWLRGVLTQAPGAVAPWDEENVERDLQQKRPYRERERQLRDFDTEVQRVEQFSRVSTTQFREQRRQEGLQDEFKRLLERSFTRPGGTAELLGVTRDVSNVITREPPQVGPGGRPAAPEVLPEGLGGKLGVAVRGDFFKGNAAAEQALIQATERWEGASLEVLSVQRKIAEQKRLIDKGDRTRETSLAMQRDLQEQLAAAHQRLMDADMRRLQAARDFNAVEVERLSSYQKQFAEASRLASLEAQREKDRLQSLKEQFGIQDAMTRQSTARVAEKLGRGEVLTREELDVARSQPLLTEKLVSEGQKRATEDDTLRRIEAALGTNRRVQELEKAAAQLNQIQVDIGNKVEATFKVNEEALAEQLKKQVIPVISQAIAQVRQQLQTEITRSNFERAASQRPAAGQ